MSTVRYRVEIRYCPKCRWLLRTAWYAQELLESFTENLSEVSLIPDHEMAGTFSIMLGEHRIWDRKSDGGFPDIKSLKQRVRDIVEPNRDLGHIDRA